MNVSGKNNLIRLKLLYYISAFITFLGGTCIYAFFRNIDNMFMFRFFEKPSFLYNLNNSPQTNSIWVYMFIYNLPYGLWCFSGLLLVRGIWLHNKKWRAIYSGVFIAIVMFYVILKLPGIIPGTFDILDLIIMGFFAFVESMIYKAFIRRYL